MIQFLIVYFSRNLYFNNKHRIEIILYARLFYPEFKTLTEAYNHLVFFVFISIRWNKPHWVVFKTNLRSTMLYPYKEIAKEDFIKMHTEKLFGSHQTYGFLKSIFCKKYRNFFLLLTGNATSQSILSSFRKVSIQKLLISFNAWRFLKHGKSSRLFTE
mgnify:FL=1